MRDYTYKLRLYREICNWYNYNFNISEEGVVTEFKDRENYRYYENIEDALKCWVSTLIETNKEQQLELGKDEIIWKEHEIEFIKNL